MQLDWELFELINWIKIIIQHLWYLPINLWTINFHQWKTKAVDPPFQILSMFICKLPKYNFYCLIGWMPKISIYWLKSILNFFFFILISTIYILRQIWYIFNLFYLFLRFKFLLESWKNQVNGFLILWKTQTNYS